MPQDTLLEMLHRPRSLPPITEEEQALMNAMAEREQAETRARRTAERPGISDAAWRAAYGVADVVDPVVGSLADLAIGATVGADPFSRTQPIWEQRPSMQEVGELAATMLPVGAVSRGLLKAVRPTVGRLKTLYHGTYRTPGKGKDFGTEAGGFHAGTLLSAFDRLSQTAPSQSRSANPRIFSYQIPTNNIYRKSPPLNEMDMFYLHGTPSKIESLREAGYDAVEYVNKVEDPGSLSYLVINPRSASEVSVQDVSMLARNLDTWRGIKPLKKKANIRELAEGRRVRKGSKGFPMMFKGKR